jgi:hypothetical protein
MHAEGDKESTTVGNISFSKVIVFFFMLSVVLLDHHHHHHHRLKRYLSI